MRPFSRENYEFETDTLEYVSETKEFTVAELPGSLTDEGKLTLARRLVRNGLVFQSEANQERNYECDKSSEHYSESVTLTHKAYVKLWASLQGALYPYVKDLMPLVDRSLVDPRFRDEMLQNPDAVFKEAGIEFSEGVRIMVVEDSQEARYLVLPPPVETIPAKRMSLLNQC